MQQHFNLKLSLPTELEVRYCASDNFVFATGGSQSSYDQYYKMLANDTHHVEVSEGSPRSLISKRQQGYLLSALEGFFRVPRKVFDFGCGQASLLVELASEFPASTFVGYDPGPAARVASQNATKFNLANLSIVTMEEAATLGPFDLLIASHVVEHLVEFDLLQSLRALLADDGFLYVEVPNALKYADQTRREFLYYFDRLHVNHFSPQSLGLLAARYGFSCVKHFDYAFPYRDGGDYPALGALFRKKARSIDISSPSLLGVITRYIAEERLRAHSIAEQFKAYDGVLVWGAGDNFFRSIESEGPLGDLHNFIVLDRRQQEIWIRNRKYTTRNPEDCILRYPWPVVITVSDGRRALGELVEQIDPGRNVFFI
ncbi:MAG TPA: class I SAM-dependent methyltransferase [Terracidiphilus sp.]|nr:class I SAM-dependent methyltransferase [Terracidiphilus sp.]